LVVAVGVVVVGSCGCLLFYVVVYIGVEDAILCCLNEFACFDGILLHMVLEEAGAEAVVIT